jgi:hypothetical protein
MTLGSKNDEGNIVKVRRVLDSTAKGHDSLRALLAWEKGLGVHKPGGVLADPSAAIALLWMRRTLQFQAALLTSLVGDPTASKSVGELAKVAYARELESVI